MKQTPFKITGAGVVSVKSEDVLKSENGKRQLEACRKLLKAPKMKLNKVIIAGGRDFTNKILLGESLSRIIWEYETTIISGCAKGADTLAIEYAEARGVDLVKMPADWDKYGKSAGVRRNEEMAKVADTLIAFWDGKSRGTKDMIHKALTHGLELHVYRY